MLFWEAPNVYQTEFYPICLERAGVMLLEQLLWGFMMLGRFLLTSSEWQDPIPFVSILTKLSLHFHHPIDGGQIPANPFLLFSGLSSLNLSEPRKFLRYELEGDPHQGPEFGFVPQRTVLNTGYSDSTPTAKLFGHKWLVLCPKSHFCDIKLHWTEVFCLSLMHRFAFQKPLQYQ